MSEKKKTNSLTPIYIRVDCDGSYNPKAKSFGGVQLFSEGKPLTNDDFRAQSYHGYSHVSRKVK